MKTTPNDVSNQEILEAISSFSEHVDARFENVEATLATKASKEDVIELKRDVAGLKSETAELHSDLGKVKNGMVTKGYLDDKLADFHSDIIRHTQKEIERATK